MAKKKKKTRPRKRTARPKQTAPVATKRSRLPLLALIAGGALVIIGGFFLYQAKKTPTRSPVLAESKNVSIKLRENRLTLSPQRFSGKARVAYEIARTIPEVLDRLYCYCRCRENFGHKNLLSCYVDTHAST